MTTADRIDQSETHVFKTVFPEVLNHHNTMFGGQIMMMMTETAFITATRYCRKSFVIVKADAIEFFKPIPASSLIELVGRVEQVGNASIHIKVNVYLEKMQEEFREKVVSGSFVLVAIDENHKPLKIEG